MKALTTLCVSGSIGEKSILTVLLNIWCVEKAILLAAEGLQPNDSHVQSG